MQVPPSITVRSRAGTNADFLHLNIWPSKRTIVQMFVVWAFSDSHFLPVHFAMSGYACFAKIS